MKKTYTIAGLTIVISLAALFIFIRLSSKVESDELDFAIALKGSLEIVVSGTGELIPERMVDIRGPKLTQYRNIRMAGVKITDIIPEGSQVKKGDYIATLDRTNFDNNLKDELANLDVLKRDVEMKILDTAVSLGTLRDEIRNQTFAVEEARLTLERSKFEPPATIRRAELELDKGARLLEQKKKNYLLKRQQTIADIKNVTVNLNIQKRKVDDLNEILSSFVINAPSDGLLIYKTDRSGVKIKTGSTLDPFDPVVATLPDLSSMLSKMHVSEVEVNKVKPGLPVQITLDALSDAVLTGSVISIANIGEQLPNSDSKMFEVLIRVNEADPRLMPSMTTTNKVVIETFLNVTYVPIESIHAGEDSIPYVYTKNGTKSVVIPGVSNEKNTIIEKGIEPGTTVWRRTPDDPSDFKLTGKDLIPLIQEKNREIALSGH
jgi:multidrug efflux pump subunit AcrA (membrane-fusion protein)